MRCEARYFNQRSVSKVSVLVDKLSKQTEILIWGISSVQEKFMKTKHLFEVYEFLLWWKLNSLQKAKLSGGQKTKKTFKMTWKILLF